MSDDIAWRVEEACHNAWPCPRQMLLGRWLLRAAGGPSRRINSLNPLRAAAYEPGPVLAEAEAVLAALGRPLLVRVPAMAAGLAEALAREGFVLWEENCTLVAPLDEAAADGAAGVAIADEPGADWLDLRSRLNGRDPAADAVARAAIGALLLPRAFAGVPSAAGTLASIAFGVVDRGWLVIEAVATEPAARGRGLARRAVAGLMGWGRHRGASMACLQVAAGNMQAHALYRRLGFHTDLYRYGYYRRPVDAG